MREKWKLHLGVCIGRYKLLVMDNLSQVVFLEVGSRRVRDIQMKEAPFSCQLRCEGSFWPVPKDSTMKRARSLTLGRTVAQCKAIQHTKKNQKQVQFKEASAKELTKEKTYVSARGIIVPSNVDTRGLLFPYLFSLLCSTTIFPHQTSTHSFSSLFSCALLHVYCGFEESIQMFDLPFSRRKGSLILGTREY
jgi:hypothetical protein